MKIFAAGQQIDVAGHKKFDQASATVLYSGEALPGSSEADASWQIKRTTFDAGGFPLKIEWANAGQATAIWANRASLTYL